MAEAALGNSERFNVLRVPARNSRGQILRKPLITAALLWSADGCAVKLLQCRNSERKTGAHFSARCALYLEIRANQIKQLVHLLRGPVTTGTTNHLAGTPATVQCGGTACSTTLPARRGNLTNFDIAQNFCTR